MKIQIVNPMIKKHHLMPATEGSAGIDLRACITETITLYAGQTVNINTGIKTAIPDNWVGLITPRSGLGCKQGIILGNSIGVIDADYRGEIIVCLLNRNQEGRPFIVEPMDKIAQMLIVPHYNYNCNSIVDSLDDTIRGSGGFNSTGTK